MLRWLPTAEYEYRLFYVLSDFDTRLLGRTDDWTILCRETLVIIEAFSWARRKYTQWSGGGGVLRGDTDHVGNHRSLFG